LRDQSLTSPLYFSVSHLLPYLHPLSLPLHSFFFFFNATPTPEIYTLSLHDALPISLSDASTQLDVATLPDLIRSVTEIAALARRSEEHTSELQSRGHLVCRLLLEKKKRIKNCSDVSIL